MIRRTALAAAALLLPLGAVACAAVEQEAQSRVDELQAEAEASVSSLVQREADKVDEFVRGQLEDPARDVREAALRNAAAGGGVAPFAARGVTVDGVLACSATSEAAGQYQVDCTGRSTDGRAVALTGSDPGEAASSWVGSVDGQELFREACVAVC